MAHNGPEIKNPGLSPRQQPALPILAAAHCPGLPPLQSGPPHFAPLAPGHRIPRPTCPTAAPVRRARQRLPPKPHLSSCPSPRQPPRESKPENQNPRIKTRESKPGNPPPRHPGRPQLLRQIWRNPEIQDLHDQVQALEAALPLWTAREKPV